MAALFTVKTPDYELLALQSNRQLTEDERKQVAVLLHTATGSWDWNALSGWSAADLREWGMDKDTLKGWQSDAKELTELLNSEQTESADAEPQIDRAAELAEKWHTATGQLWKLGEHRLLIGDCTVRENVERLMGGEKWQIGFTSPPYNSGDADFTYDYHAPKEGGFYDGGKDNMSEDDYKKMCFDVLSNYAFLADDLHSLFWNVMYNANSRDTYGKIVFSENNPFMVRETIVWNKIGGFPVAGTNIMSRNSELIFLLSLNEKYLSNQTLRNCIYWNRWDISNSNSQQKDAKHKACFPVDLPQKAIADFSKDGNIVLDLFCGSGTTIIAAHNLNRRCYAMEISEKYGAVILERFYTATGIMPELAENGTP